MATCNGTPISGLRLATVAGTLAAVLLGPGTAPAQEISLKVVRPSPGENLTIDRGATFVIGTVSPPRARVTINGVAADVSDDGAFLAMAPIQLLSKPQSIPLPNGAARRVNAAFECVVRSGGHELQHRILVATPAVQDNREPALKPFSKPEIFRIREEQILSQTAATNWGLLYLPQDARVSADARKGNRVRLRLGIAEETWVNDEILQSADAVPGPAAISVRTIGPHETRFDVGARVPYSIEQLDSPPRLQVSFLGPDGGHSFAIPVAGARSWGFASHYETNSLIVTERPAPDLSTGLRGKVICLDPGHNPDTGAIGPRGFEEREANLKIALALEKLLTAAGARVVFTHRGEPLPLQQRRTAALRYDPDLFVSLHNNSVNDGIDPRTNYGSSTYYYHPQSRALAETVQASMLAELGFPDLHASRKSLFVCRISECPAILVESAFLILPDQEKMLMSESGQEKVARAIGDGIRNFFQSVR